MQTVKEYIISLYVNKGISENESEKLVSQSRNDIELYLNTSIDTHLLLNDADIKDIKKIIKASLSNSFTSNLRKKPFDNVADIVLNNLGLKQQKLSKSKLRLFGQRINMYKGKKIIPHKHILFYPNAYNYITKHRAKGFEVLY
jgi:hypothetical protein